MDKLIEDIITALASAGMGVNIIVVDGSKKEEKEETDSFPTDPYEIFSGGLASGGSSSGGGLAPEDAWLV